VPGGDDVHEVAVQAQRDALSGDEGADGDPVSADVDHAVAVGGAVDLNGRNRLVGLQGWCCRCGPGGAGAAHGEVLQVFGGQPGGDGLEVLAGVGEVDSALVGPHVHGAAGERPPDPYLLVSGQAQGAAGRYGQVEFDRCQAVVDALVRGKVTPALRYA